MDGRTMVQSSPPSDRGHSFCLRYGDPVADKGIKTTPDAKFFAISAELEETFDNKDTDLVIQYSVKHEQRLDCGGGYMKIMAESR